MTINPLTTPQTQPAHHHHGGGGHRKQVMDAAAKTLGVSADALQQDLRNGQSLDDVAKAQGVSHDALVSGLTDALGQAGAPQGDLATIAERLATRRWDDQSPGGDGASTPRAPLGSMVDVSA